MVKRNLKIRIVIFLIVFITLILFYIDIHKTAELLRERRFDIVIAFIFAIIAAKIIEYVYQKIWPSKIYDRDTIVLSESIFAKLILPNNYEIKLTEGFENPKIIRKSEFSIENTKMSISRWLWNLIRRVLSKPIEYEKIFGREDFVGAVSVEDIQFIGKKHFKIIKDADGVYIEDMDSANGTKLDKREIKGSGQQKLEDGVIIRVADVLDLEYKVVIGGK